jgi:hypothetical protein
MKHLSLSTLLLTPSMLMIDYIAPVVFLKVRDNCAGVVTPVADNSNFVEKNGFKAGTCANYEIVRTWTICDPCHNSRTYAQRIKVEDKVAPKFNEALPVSKTVECDSIPKAHVLTAGDNCGSAVVTYQEVPVPGACPNSYVLKRTWTATNLSDLTTTHQIEITVQDTTHPVLYGVPKGQGLLRQCTKPAFHRDCY